MDIRDGGGKKKRRKETVEGFFLMWKKIVAN
jgi:hypothetical protein